MSYVFPPAPRVSVPVTGGSALFPVRRIYCVGRNYADHAAEMGADTREPPFFFSKPADALVPGGGDIAYPPATSNLQHEVELVVALRDGGADILPERALEYVYGYAVGLDLTRRDLQQLAKDKGHPWDMGKGFDQSAPIGAIHPLAALDHPTRGSIWLKVNGQLRQSGDLQQMSWKVAEVIARLSGYVALAAGDLIFTGTPAGVSTVVRGDVLEAGVAGVGELTIRLV
ncbi:MAG: fumarylacetoacetate hydrolase family protein [Candidatus Accumulibacter sp.]|jgi:fumarylpyruvate hydrolase|uniref:fumarylacetoacetate hydrolase family protein n=1 Tax=Accumulibacter sp. TaxID=2053492 RepID=UPI00208C96F4|nr:fumarylacetoacetate hydrolase family protein [Accumulibacter sp.]MBK8114498.1 fumarylacetoacetate hydrolase family protein [Accumulibacter sp.]MBK8384544.1 fumarylacetoacetate hydrolase family protein [Accumulibacter sp.]MBK8578016.1 fumarylacetoacetate hydrolase family protein [Candidatus Accumulibacter propinquus]